MTKDVRWERVFPAGPDTVFDAITRRSAGWLWEIDYEPRVNGAVKGLTPSGGLVTAWEPGRLFRTRADGPDGWFNQVEFRLEPTADGTRVHYVHSGSYAENPLEFEQCTVHTDFYREILAEYVQWFAGRDARHVEIELPGSFAEVCARLDQADAFYRAPHFLGLRTSDSLIAVFGRDVWGYPVSVSVHAFEGDAADPDVDPDAVRARWQAEHLSPITTEAVHA